MTIRDILLEIFDQSDPKQDMCLESDLSRYSENERNSDIVSKSLYRVSNFLFFLLVNRINLIASYSKFKVLSFLEIPSMIEYIYTYTLSNTVIYTS